jgi:probable O-glycosylation ligase (exosortase A-associated)
MRDLLVTAVLLGAVPFVLFAPYIGILFWSLIGYLNLHRFVWGFAGTIPFAEIIGVSTLIGLFLSKEEKRFPLTTLTVVWITFIAWISFTTLFALYPDLAYTKWLFMAKVMLMSFVTLLVMARRERVDLLVWVIVLSLGFYGFKGGLFTITHMTGTDVLVYGPPKSFIEDNNAIGLALVMALPLMNYLRKKITHRLMKWGMWCVMGLSLTAVIGTHSRGAALGLAAVGGAALLQSRYKTKALAALVLTALVGSAFVPQAWVERIQTVRHYEQDDSAMSRINSWHTSYNLASDRLLGGGFDSLQTETYLRYSPGPAPPRALNAHSIYFEVLVEHGFIGLGLFLLLGAMALRTSTWIRQHTEGRDDLTWARELAASTRLGLIGYFVSGAFLNLAYFDLYYHVIGILVLTRVIVERSLAEEVKTTLGSRTTTDRLASGTIGS